MSGNPISALIFAAVFVIIGGLMAFFPKNTFFQVKDLGPRFGKVSPGTRLLGVVLFVLGLMLTGMVLFVNV